VLSYHVFADSQDTSVKLFNKVIDNQIPVMNLIGGERKKKKRKGRVLLYLGMSYV